MCFDAKSKNYLNWVRDDPKDFRLCYLLNRGELKLVLSGKKGDLNNEVFKY